jgi:Protein of unknown function (DUF3352)
MQRKVHSFFVVAGVITTGIFSAFVFSNPSQGQYQNAISGDFSNIAEDATLHPEKAVYSNNSATLDEKNISQQKFIPLGATITPQNALLSITVLSDQSSWQKLGQFGTPQTKLSWQKQLKRFESNFLTPFSFTYEKDILPWVGQQINLVLLSPAPEDAAYVGANVTVWFLQMRDPQQARAVLSRAAGNKAQKRIYRDVEVQTFKGKNGKTISAVVLDNRLLIVSNGNNTLNQVIDTYRGSPSLAQIPRLQEAMNEVNDSAAFAQVYINVLVATAGLRQNVRRGTAQSAQQVQGVGSTIKIEDGGLKFKAISWLKPDSKQQLNSINKPQTLVRLLPADTLMIASGGDFRQSWQDFTVGNATQLLVPLDANKIQASLLKSTGVDFKKDFVSWMDGEFVVALVPTTNQSKQFSVGIMFLAKANDRTKADLAFHKLDAAIRDRKKIMIAESKMGNHTITAWKVPPNLPIANHGWLDGDVAFFTFGAPISERILTPQNSSLAEAPLFKRTQSANLGNNTGQFFVDLPRMVTMMHNSPLLPKLAPSANQFAQAIEAIGVTSAINNPWSTRYDVIVKLKTLKLKH